MRSVAPRAAMRLLLVLMALGIGPGDEVIVPSFTFFATASAVWRLGAKPVFAEIVPDTFNLDPADVVYKITSDTKAIIPVHLFGQCAAMEDICKLPTRPAAFRSSKTPARRLGPSTRAIAAGSLGMAGCFSFYPTKNLGGFGDGGLITTNDAELAAKLRVLRNHGQQPRYYHHFVGLNSRLDSLQAAVLNVKLPKLDDWCAARERHARAIHGRVHGAWRGGCDRRADGGQGLPARVEPVHRPREERSPRCACRNTWPIGKSVRQFTIRFHSTCKNVSHRSGYEPGSLRKTEQACREVLSLPVYPELTAAEQGAVIGAVAEFCAEPQSGGRVRWSRAESQRVKSSERAPSGSMTLDSRLSTVYSSFGFLTSDVRLGGKSVIARPTITPTSDDRPMPRSCSCRRELRSLSTVRGEESRTEAFGAPRFEMTIGRSDVNRRTTASHSKLAGSSCQSAAVIGPIGSEPPSHSSSGRAARRKRPVGMATVSQLSESGRACGT